ncbi:unnamed protein product [Penicillium salamii]|uniref:Fe2OG dioxygenase domain-containing protein n=1 Tax=Penicillium salamii TaxID=1612424 RepID=A0A9W4MXP1_9EURO|nr:unnamed protein product [Penicillium salamii]
MTPDSPVQGASVPIARLDTISLAKVVANDRKEVNKMLMAFINDGFLYLSLDQVVSITADWDKVVDFMNSYFDQPLNKKMKDDRSSDTIGYEPCGTSAGVARDQVDSYESLKISKSQIDSLSGLTQSVEQDIALFQRFIENSHNATMTILGRLSSLFPNIMPFEAAHDASEKSKSTLAMFRYPRQEPNASLTADVASAGHNKHTDLGTLTFLLTREWGLQVLQASAADAGKDVWAFVEPRAGHAIINVGDSLRFLSGARLKSAVHRVVPVSRLDEHGCPVAEDVDTTNVLQGGHRHSIAYFLRPADKTVYHTSEDKPYTALEWHDKKFDTFRQSRDVQDALGIHTGGMEQGGMLVHTVASAAF